MKKFMKKFILSMVVMFMFAISSLSAQSTTCNASIGDNWFAGVNVGTVAPVGHSFDWAEHNWLGDYHKEFGIEVGKWITPVTALGVSYEVQGDLNDSKTWADMGLVTADAHFNLTNLFAGYKGTPRRFEVEAIPSVGFVHYYGNIYPAPHRFMAAGRFAISANYNFGKNREWAVYVRPGIEYIDRVRHYNGLFDVRAGVTYKFKGTKSKSHNFVLCPYSVTQSDYDALSAELKACQEAPAKVVRQEVEVVKEVPVESASTVVINFEQGKADLTSDSKEVLDKISGNATIVASASPEGGKSFNQTLSERRAEAIKLYLENRGVKVTSAEGVGVTGNNSNRIAIVTYKK